VGHLFEGVWNALHGLGLVMSHKWMANVYGTISNKAMQEVQREIQTEPFIASHDNVNIPLRVFLQRLHNQSHFISGCAATIWILPKDAALPWKMRTGHFKCTKRKEARLASIMVNFWMEMRRQMHE